MVVVAEGWRDNAGTRGKMFGHLEKAFLRENFVRRVAGIEHPPMKDAVERILCLRMHCQIVQNFWRRRWK